MTEASGVWQDVPDQWQRVPSLAGSSGPSQGAGKAMPDAELAAYVSG